MSNFAQEFEDDEQFQSAVASQSSTGSPPPAEKGRDASTVSKKKRNLPGNPGKQTINTIHLIHTRDSLMEGLFKHILKQLSRILKIY